VLFSSANIGSLRCPIPQVLLVRNTIYFDPYIRDRVRSPWARARTLAERRLVVASVLAADVVLFPSQAMLDLVAIDTGGPRSSWHVAPYGARRDLFKPTPGAAKASHPVTVLHVSHYCEQKNIGTLLQAMSCLESSSPGQYRLRMTAGMRDLRPGSRWPSLTEDLRRYTQLEAQGVALDLGSRPYSSLPDLYRSADVFVFPSYTESFGHPLVEAMASGVPVVAADVPVNREMCGDAALYFPPFDAAACAEVIARVVEDSELARQLGERGLGRAEQFTWERHVEALWSAIEEVVSC
jgi:glycosyltransferase involved in cell wall biosynthesis